MGIKSLRHLEVHGSGDSADMSGSVDTSEPLPFISFIIPAFNEEGMVRNTIVSLTELCEELELDYEIIAVNDGSTDSTSIIIDEISSTLSQVKSLHNPTNMGLGNAYKKGAEAASGDYIMMIPGDDAHPKEGLIDILNVVGTSDIIVPFPANPIARSFSRRIISRLYTFIINILFGTHVPYFNGLVVHRRVLLGNIEIRTNSFAYQTEALLKMLSQGVQYTTVPTIISERNDRGSKAFRMKNVIDVLGTILQLFYELRLKPTPNTNEKKV